MKLRPPLLSLRWFVRAGALRFSTAALVGALSLGMWVEAADGQGIRIRYGDVTGIEDIDPVLNDLDFPEPDPAPGSSPAPGSNPAPGGNAGAGVGDAAGGAVDANAEVVGVPGVPRPPRDGATSSSAATDAVDAPDAVDSARESVNDSAADSVTEAPVVTSGGPGGEVVSEAQANPSSSVSQSRTTNNNTAQGGTAEGGAAELTNDNRNDNDVNNEVAVNVEVNPVFEWPTPPAPPAPVVVENPNHPALAAVREVREAGQATLDRTRIACTSDPARLLEAELAEIDGVRAALAEQLRIAEDEAASQGEGNIHRELRRRARERAAGLQEAIARLDGRRDGPVRALGQAVALLQAEAAVCVSAQQELEVSVDKVARVLATPVTERPGAWRAMLDAEVAGARVALSERLFPPLRRFHGSWLSARASVRDIVSDAESALAVNQRQRAGAIAYVDDKIAELDRYDDRIRRAVNAAVDDAGFPERPFDQDWLEKRYPTSLDRLLTERVRVAKPLEEYGYDVPPAPER
ncbi:MAG: hypothetical protein AAGA57_08345 [Planctomycetota bacterium]